MDIPEIIEVANFTNRSLGHTDVKLTWDEPNQERLDFIKNLNPEELEKVDWSKYIGEDSDSEQS